MKGPGLLLINKPIGITSFQFLFPIKKRLGTKKIGHAGTLDKFAEGLMLVLVGQCTRFSQYLTGLNKSYKAELHFGTETDTLDPEGHIIARAPLPDRDRVFSSLVDFRGLIHQVPPKYSALHLNGKRAHQRIRNGESFEIPSREVKVSALRLINYNGLRAVIDVECSKGTYVRSLARDIGLRAQSRAHLGALTRTVVGSFCCTEALSLEDFISLSDGEIEKRVIWGSKLLQLIPDLRLLTVDDEIKTRIERGMPLYGSDLDFDRSDAGSPIGLLSKRDEILALVEPPELNSATDSSQQLGRLKYRGGFNN